MAASGLVRAAAMLALAALAAAQPFPCGSAPPCVDSTMLIGGTIPCDTMSVPDVCAIPGAPELCIATCLTCAICEEPMIPSSLEAVVQIAMIAPNTFSIWINSQTTIAGVQGNLVCLSNGEVIVLDVLPDVTVGPEYAAQQFTISTGIEGRFLSISFPGGLVAPGYNQFGAISGDMSGASNFSLCDPGSIGLNNVVLSDPVGLGIPVCGGYDAPCPMMPSPAATVLSDPHFIGFRGQSFDVSGVAGTIYSLIADHDLYVNAKFSTAFTTGIFLNSDDGDVKQMRAHGTWMSEIGVVVNGFMLEVSVDSAVSKAEECEVKPSDCIRYGSVTIDGNENVYLVGAVTTESDVGLQIVNKKSTTIVILESELMDLTIDVVPPPQVWEVSATQYFHLNMQLNKIQLTEQVSGVLGDSARIKYDARGQAIMTATDKNGAGILEKSIEMYEVDSLLSTSAPLFQGKGEAFSATSTTAASK